MPGSKVSFFSLPGHTPLGEKSATADGRVEMEVILDDDVDVVVAVGVDNSGVTKIKSVPLSVIRDGPHLQYRIEDSGSDSTTFFTLSNAPAPESFTFTLMACGKALEDVGTDGLTLVDCPESARVALGWFET